jgi:hypothetical protein
MPAAHSDGQSPTVILDRAGRIHLGESAVGDPSHRTGGAPPPYSQGKYAAPYKPASFPSVAFSIAGLVAR